jgi:RimJ/RimL family protein N-acetyltransferase
VGIEQVWPLFGLRVETPRLVLRTVTDDDLEPLAEAAIAGVHDADRTPFAVPWTDAPPEELRRSLARFHWRLRAQTTPADWWLALAVEHDGRLIGSQDVRGVDFAALRTVSSGSWLTRSAQGRGFGTEMRAGMLQLAFDHLGAEWAESGASSWNSPSLRVSEKLGYRPNGIARMHPRADEVVDKHRLRLHRDAFVRPGWTASVTLPRAARAQLLG